MGCWLDYRHFKTSAAELPFFPKLLVCLCLVCCGRWEDTYFWEVKWLGSDPFAPHSLIISTVLSEESFGGLDPFLS